MALWACGLALCLPALTSAVRAPHKPDSERQTFQFTTRSTEETEWVQRILKEWPPFSPEERALLKAEAVKGKPRVEGEAVFVLTGGLPGAGKSSVRMDFVRGQNLEPEDFVVLDADDMIMRTRAMRAILDQARADGLELPQDLVVSAFHMKARDFVQGDLIRSVAFAAGAPYNTIFDSTCSNFEYCKGLVDSAVDAGYGKVLFVSVDTDEECVRRRLWRRASRTGRFVPEAVVRDKLSRTRASLRRLSEYLASALPGMSAQTTRDGTSEDCRTREYGGLLLRPQTMQVLSVGGSSWGPTTPCQAGSLSEAEECAVRAMAAVGIDKVEIASDWSIVDPWSDKAYFLMTPSGAPRLGAGDAWRPASPATAARWALARGERSRRGLPASCPPAAEGDNFEDLEVLSGSTFPVKTRYKPDGTVWVRKAGDPNAEMHTFNEYLTHQIYWLGGAKAPSCCYYGRVVSPDDPDPQGPEQMLCEFIEGLRHINGDGLQAMDSLGDHFVLNAVLGNFDIKDQNVMWMPDGLDVVFLDNGAGLAKQAGGKWKDVEYDSSSKNYVKRAAAWTREPWSLWDFRRPHGDGGFRDLDLAFRRTSPEDVIQQADRLSQARQAMLDAFPPAYSDVRAVFEARLDCTLALAKDTGFLQKFGSGPEEVVPYVRRVCGGILQRIPAPPRRAQRHIEAPRAKLPYVLPDFLAESLPRASCSLPNWGEEGVVVVPDHPHHAAGAFLDLIECAGSLKRPLGVEVWKLDEPNVRQALFDLQKSQSQVSVVMNTWDLSQISKAHSFCAPYLGSGYTEKMAAFQDTVEMILDTDMPDTGAFGARTFLPERACAFHNKLWVVKDVVAAVVTYNAGKVAPYVDIGVLIHDPDLVQSLFELHRWDFECNAEGRANDKGQPACTQTSPPALHPAVLPGFQFQGDLPDMRGAYKRLITGATGKVTVVSPSFTEPSVADWLRRLRVDKGVDVDLITTWQYWGAKGQFNSEHDYNTFKLGGAAARVLNVQDPKIHAKLLLFHGPVRLATSDPLRTYMETCKCPFLITSANIYPGMWRSRELGVVLCSCGQWKTLHDHVWKARGEAEMDWRMRVKALVETEAGADAQGAFAALRAVAPSDGDERDAVEVGHFAGDERPEQLLRTADLNGDGSVTRGEFLQTWAGVLPETSPKSN